MKAHTVTKVEARGEEMIVFIDRLGQRLLRCGVCRKRCKEVHDIRKPREWRNLRLKHRARPPVHVIGMDEVSRRKGQVYLTVIYDLERRVLLWVGEDRTEAGTVRWSAPGRAKDHLTKWMNSAMRSRLEPFKNFVRMLRSYLDGVLAWTKTRISNGAVEGMNNKIKSISHRLFGFRSAKNFIAAIYHCCAQPPLPAER